MAEKYRVVMHTKEDNKICVEVAKLKWMHFNQAKVGLFVHDMRRGLVDFSGKNSNKNVDLYSFFQIVDDLKKNFTAPELKLANKVNASCKRIGSPALKKFPKGLNRGHLE